MDTPDFFRSRIDSMIDLRSPLAVLATRIPWARIEAVLTPKFEHEDRAGQVVQGQDLRRKAGGYAHAKQFRRLQRTVKRQRTILGIVMREVQRKLAAADFAGSSAKFPALRHRPS